MGSIVSDVVGVFTGAGDVTDAANAAAAQQREAAQNAAYSAAFRPVGTTSRFGTSQFTREIDPKTGAPYVSSAGYTPAPELSALQNRLFSQFVPSMMQAEQVAGQYAPLGTAASQLMSLGQGYLAKTPEQAAQDYMTSQQNLLAGPREQQLAGLRNKVFQTGRSGLGVGATTTGQRAANPEMQAYFNSLANQDLQLASQATQAGQQRSTFGAGLLGTGAGLLGSQVQGQVGAYAPLQNQLGLSGQVESMAQMPLNLGLQIGSAQVPGQTAGAQLYGQGMQQAAQTQYAGAQQAAQMNAAFLNNLIGSAAGAYGMSQMGGAPTGVPGGGYLTQGTSFPSFGISAIPSTGGGFGMSPFSSGGFGIGTGSTGLNWR
jgi:hypothetical protein